MVANAAPVVIDIGSVHLAGDLATPSEPTGVVLFAHGSGSSRHSPRNRMVADVLHRAGFATLLLDLLTPGEEEEDQRTRGLRFDIPLLAQRLVGAVDWLAANPRTAELQVGTFGASTGAAAALIAAGHRPDRVVAVVSRGGRPDLAGEALSAVVAPTLLIVGGEDHPVIDLNRRAQQELRAPVQLVLVEGATHLFEEHGALERVADLAIDWFTRHLG